MLEMNQLDENELEVVSGGATAAPKGQAGNSQLPFACQNPKCGEIFYIKAGTLKVRCPKCKRVYEIKG